jgi:glycine/D-amino acid oxidase-like deaminating enzyme
MKSLGHIVGAGGIGIAAAACLTRTGWALAEFEHGVGKRWRCQGAPFIEMDEVRILNRLAIEHYLVVPYSGDLSWVKQW